MSLLDGARAQPLCHRRGPRSSQAGAAVPPCLVSCAGQAASGKSGPVPLPTPDLLGSPVACALPSQHLVCIPPWLSPLPLPTHTCTCSCLHTPSPTGLAWGQAQQRKLHTHTLGCRRVLVSLCLASPCCPCPPAPPHWVAPGLSSLGTCAWRTQEGGCTSTRPQQGPGVQPARAGPGAIALCRPTHTPGSPSLPSWVLRSKALMSSYQGHPSLQPG